MPGYETRKLKVRVGANKYRIRALSDLQQFADPCGTSKRAGISSATWSLFGQIWPASRILAKAVAEIDIEGRRILELGCGLGLASLVLQQRGADITATDYHPLVEPFLDYNAELNDLPPIAYQNLPWEIAAPDLGRFDLIIGSDILYERNHAELLARLIKRHALPDAEVLITCPGRGYRGRFSRALEAQGYHLTQKRKRFDEDEVPPYRGRLLRYRRGDIWQTSPPLGHAS
jgi:predicted nicotinamide N-methyase